MFKKGNFGISVLPLRYPLMQKNYKCNPFLGKTYPFINIFRSRFIYWAKLKYMPLRIKIALYTLRFYAHFHLY